MRSRLDGAHLVVFAGSSVAEQVASLGASVTIASRRPRFEAAAQTFGAAETADVDIWAAEAVC
ncbi:hypothetical protein [Amorphus orientalis]|uniref:Uncharacterized protein n=1 Tax=Amorphus orientalis TaxID=649198 RepID=A0AAE3VNE3_9HYPH|nr:hypothetical protein [Amorphus orientalis]MDQ0315789.1 hypothetical protein [Amorphus orientalis]